MDLVLKASLVRKAEKTTQVMFEQHITMVPTKASFAIIDKLN